jgi:ADP-ribose pyrophosphatase YjhB (NUDIX family)
MARWNYILLLNKYFKNNIISLENTSGAFLKNNGKYFLMKRSAERKIATNVWSCVGGHMEQNEINNPLDTCLREIREETGIKKEIDSIWNYGILLFVVLKI